MIRRYGQWPRRDQLYRQRPGAYAILPGRRGLLLTYQGAPHHEFQLPGGGVDPGESMLQALHREVMEETGWTIAAPRKLGVYRRFHWMEEYDFWAEKLCHIYLARPVRKITDQIEENHTALWAPVKLALEMLANDGERDILARSPL